MEIKDFEHEYTAELVCPYCGYEETDSWELRSDDGDFECSHCSKKYNYERHIQVSYSTYKIEEEK